MVRGFIQILIITMFLQGGVALAGSEGSESPAGKARAAGAARSGAAGARSGGSTSAQA